MLQGALRLLQIPNFTEKHVEACKGYSPSITTIREFLALQPDERRKLLEMKDEESLDVDSWCNFIGETGIKVFIYVCKHLDIYTFLLIYMQLHISICVYTVSFFQH